MLKAKLMVVGGDAAQTEVQLKLPTTIGRGRDANLTVPHALVSRRHSEIIERNGRLFVKDLGSLNGTFVNNQRITDETPLDPEQLLTLGNITFRAIYEIGDDIDIDNVSALDTEVIDLKSSDTRKVAGSADDSSSSQETVPVDSLSNPQQAVPNTKSSKETSQAKKKTAHQNAQPGLAAQQLPVAANSSAAQTCPQENPREELVAKFAAESPEISQLDSLAIETAGEANQEGPDGFDFGSFLRRLPR